ncbi:hypothetical protein JXA56_05455 [Candidatus Micrarchaeota archaeon]|nr:hypothetical protein [Candidatus Micrarchaeota archaeon]
MNVLEETHNFLNKPFNKFLVLGLLILGILVLLSGIGEYKTVMLEDKIHVHFFYSQYCPHCEQQKHFNDQLASEFPEIQIIPHDVAIPEEARLLQIMAQNYSILESNLGTPTTFICNHAFIGFVSEEITGSGMREAIEVCLANGNGPKTEYAPSVESLTGDIDLPFVGKSDLSHFSLPVLAIVLGLVDGFNPCAMWVLVYLISLLMGIGSRKRMFFIVAIFVLSSGILYFLFMTAWLNAFLFLGYVRPVTILVGLVALGGGILSVKDYIETKGAPVCKVTGTEHKKKIMTDMRELVSAPLTWATIAGVTVLAFAVNSIEFVCSAAIPAIFTQVLALSSLSFLEYYGYIILYVIFFMLDDMLVFGFAALTLSGTAGEKYSAYSKIIGGAILLILGFFLLFAPYMLR